MTTTEHEHEQEQEQEQAQEQEMERREEKADAPKVEQEQAGREVRRRERRTMSPFDLWALGPFELMRRWSDDIDRLFAQLGMPEDMLAARGMWAPRIDVLERGDELVVRADLPGLKKEDVHLSLIGDDLVIEGERRSESEREEGGAHLSERGFGRFRRTVELPAGADAGSAQAAFRDGVLEIRLKVASREGRSIEIGEPDEGEPAREEGAEPRQEQQGAEEAAEATAPNDVVGPVH